MPSTESRSGTGSGTDSNSLGLHAPGAIRESEASSPLSLSPTSRSQVDLPLSNLVPNPLHALSEPAVPAPAMVASNSTGGSASASGGTSAGTTERRGGMAQNPSGAKTPRKNVQWAASTKGEGPMNSTGSSHLLDEEGLDVSDSLV